MYLFISSEASRQWYAGPSANSFTITLPKQLAFPGDWECCLKELRINRDSDLEGLFYVCCDIVEASISGGVEASVLRTFDLEQKAPQAPQGDRFIFENGYYFTLNKTNLTRINIYITDISLNLVKGFQKVHCVLHLRKTW